MSTAIHQTPKEHELADHIAQLQGNLAQQLPAEVPAITTLGASLIAISPQTPDSTLTTVEKKELTFSVLSDVGNVVARSYGLVSVTP